MRSPGSPRFNHVRRGSPRLVAVLLLAACQSAESKQMKALAGDYVATYDSEILPGEQDPWFEARTVMTLRPEGRWTMKQTLTVRGKTDRESTDSGSYRVQGTTLATSGSEMGPGGQFTISGDTLWAVNSGNYAYAEAVTGVKVNAPKQQDFFVRER